ILQRRVLLVRRKGPIEGQDDWAPEKCVREVPRVRHMVGSEPAGREWSQYKRVAKLALDSGRFARGDTLQLGIGDCFALLQLPDHIGQLLIKVGPLESSMEITRLHACDIVRPT